jgi:hypothetical protein
MPFVPSVLLENVGFPYERARENQSNASLKAVIYSYGIAVYKNFNDHLLK